MQGTYVKARDEAKKQIRFLLIYLHDESNEETERFCREALCHPASIEFIDRRAMLWGCSIARPEGYKGEVVVHNKLLFCQIYRQCRMRD